jgi:hypothetical protein
MDRESSKIVPEAGASKPGSVQASEEDRRLEYAEVNNNIRHYSSLRFTIQTVFFAATGGLATVAFDLFDQPGGNDPTIKLSARIAGFLLTFLFFKYERLLVEVLAKNRRVGRDLEAVMGLSQISSRSRRSIVAAHWVARLLYISFLAFWSFMIWEMLRPTARP